jgi:hypothetical protein
MMITSKTSLVFHSLLLSFIWVAFTIVLAVIVGYLWREYGGISQRIAALMQYLGLAIVLWATLGKVGWTIQTLEGDTLPEKVNDFIYRSLYVIGTFFAALGIFISY